MSNCKDCGGTPAPKVNKALFFDLDHTLVRPKLQRVTMKIPKVTDRPGIKVVADFQREKVPAKNIGELEYIETESGGLNLEVGWQYRPTFPKNGEDWEFLPGVLDAIGPFLDAGYLFVIITNQGGIEAGFHTAEEVEEKLSTILFAMSASLGSKMLEQAAYFYCPSLKEHPDRKPNPGMINRAADKLGIDVYQSVFVGDMRSDWEAATAAWVGRFYYISEFLEASRKEYLLY